MKNEIVNAIKSEKVLAKHIYHHHWVSGSSTLVYPITLWSRNVEIQVDTDKNLFNGCIKRILERFPNLFSNGYFWKSDGSCPSHVTLMYTEYAMKELSAE